MINQNLTLTPDGAGAVKPNQKLSLFSQQSLVNTPEYSQDLASKYSVAMGPDSPGEDAMLSSIREGNLSRYEELIAQRKAVAAQDVRNQLVQQIADSGNRTVFDQEVVRGLSEEQLASPDVGAILEGEYSRKLTELQTSLIDEEDGTFSDAVSTNVDDAYELVDRTEWQTARNFIASNTLNGLQEKFSSAGLLSQGLAWAQQIIPFRDQVSMWGAELGDVEKSFFAGDTKEDAYAYLNTLPPNEYKTIVNKYVERELQTGNYLNAMAFVEGLLSYSESDKNWENIWEGVDVASVLPIGKLAKSLRGASRAVMTPMRDIERMATTAGLPAEAVRATMSDSLMKGVLPSHNIRGGADVERMLPSLLRPQELFAGRTLRAGGPALSRLEQAAVARAGVAAEIVSGVNRVERLSPIQIEKGLDEAVQFLTDNFVHANHKIIDVKRNLAENTPTNTYSATIVIGKTDGSTFASEIAGYKAAKAISLRTNDFKVVEQANGGWAIEVTRDVDETANGLRDLKIETDFKLPDNWKTRFAGGLLGADAVLSRSQTMARGTAVHSSEHMAHLLEYFSQPVARMNKKARKEFEEFLIRDRDYVDPINGRGMPRLTAAEFEDAFYTQFNKLPSYDQIDAYTAYRQLYDLDWIVRDLDVAKQKMVMGIEEFTVKVKGEDQTDLHKFEGKEVSDFPRGSRESFVIGVVDDAGNVIKGKGYNSRYMSSTDWDLINKWKSEGFKIIQAFNGSKKIGKEYYNFIMVRNFKRDRIGLNNVTYSKGSRVIQKDPYYLKQPKVGVGEGRGYYRGDSSVAAFRSYDEAVEAEKIMNTARLMVKNRTPGVVKYFNDNIPFWSLKDFLKKVKVGDLSLDAPIKVTKSGSRTIDSHNIAEEMNKEGIKLNEFVTENEFNLSNRITGRFLGDRLDESMDAYGVEKNTIFKLERDPLLSPLDTMRYSMSNMVDVHVIHDYRLKSVRDYTTQYADVLKGDRGDFDTEGLSYIFAPNYRDGADVNRVKSAETQRKVILSLFNNKTFVEKQVDMYKEKLIRTVRDKFGDNVANFVEDKALPAASNADTAMRAFAFHTKMGFFNIRQLFLQSTAAVNVTSIAGPIHGGRGAMAAWPLIFAMNTKNTFVRGMAEKLKGVTTFSADEFDELSRIYRKSGFYHVGGDVAYLDNFKPPEIVKGKLNSVLQVGAVPFKAGESIARSMAFAAAYSERKALMKGKTLARADEVWILQRAKDLTGNMTRDSNAAYQRGYGAIATQFFGYQMRLMEQFLGNKLTKMEKARLFTGMSLVYGVPVATGMTVGVVPVREWLKDELSKNGIVYDNTLAEPFMDGFVSQLLETSTGMDLNFSERYGPGGLTTFYDFLKGDSDLAELLMGASGGIIGETIKDTSPIIKFAWSAMDFNDSTTYPIVINDLVEPFRNISTVNNSIKLWEAANTMRWLSQNETYLTDVTMQEAITSALTGLDPERVSDTFNKIEAIQSHNDLQKQAIGDITIEYKRALQLMKDGFGNEAKAYISRAKADAIRAGLDMKQVNTAWNRAIDDVPLDLSIEEEFKKMIGEKN